MKNIVLLCSLMLIFIFGFAQTKKELNKPEYENAIATAKKQYGNTSKNYFRSVVKYLVILNEYKKSTDVIRIGTKASIEAESIFGSEDSIYLDFLLNLGKAYQETLKAEVADSLFARFILLKIKNQQTYDIDYITALDYLAQKYFSDNNYKLSLKYYEQVHYLLSKIKDTTSAQYYLSTSMGEYIREITETRPQEKWDSLDQEINRLNLAENHFEAEEIAADYLSAAEYEFGITHKNYFLSLTKYDFILLNTGSLKGGTREYEQLLNNLSEYFGHNDSLYSIGLTYLSQYYEGVEQFKSAIPVYQKLLKIDRDKDDTTSEKHFTNLEKLAAASAYLKQFKEAIPVLEELADAYSKKNNNKNDSVYLYYILTLANYEIQLEHYSKALDYYMSLYQVIEKEDTSSGGRYLDILNKIARTYSELGKFDRAELFYRKALKIIKNMYGEEHAYYFNDLNNIAATEMEQGRYTEAEIFFRQILEHDKKILRTSPANFSTTLQNLANLYNKMGLYEEAQKLFSEATQYVKSILGTKNSEFALCLYYSALTDLTNNQYEIAISKLKEAIEIDRFVSQTGTRHYLYYLQALAEANKSISNWTEAERIYKQADSIIIKNYGKVHPFYEGNLVLKGLNAMESGKFSEAEHLFKDVLKISNEIYGKDHIDYAKNLSILGLIYNNLGKTEEAIKCFSDYEKIAISFIKNNFGGLSEREKITWWNSSAYGFYLLPSTLYKNQQFTTNFSLNAFNTQLQIKGTILAESQKIITKARSNEDKKISNLYADWQRLKSVLAHEYSLPIRERNVGLKSMESMANDMEKEINHLSSTYKKQQQSIKIGYTEIKNSLDADEAAIEFVSFHLYNKKWTDSIIYAAYILKKTDTIPVFVPLFEEKQLDELSLSQGRTATQLAKAFYRGIDSTFRKSGIAGENLYKLVWQKLEPYLEGIRKISYSPAGKLNGVAFNALPCGNDQLLIDKYQLQRYISTYEIALRTPVANTLKPANIVLFGNATFTMDSLQLVAKRNNEADYLTISNRKKVNIVPWPELAGTAKEIKIISDLFELNKISTRTFSQTDASEENLKAQSGLSPEILFIGTHGFYLPPPEQQLSNQNIAYRFADDPLLRSGLILAGGNYAWMGKTPIDGVEDGILTAYEISQLNLSNTKLVVLSACETGLGDIKGSEGVFGLQRSLKMAGVKKMILSLWKVPDEATAELMTAFCSYWVNGKNINESFYKAQADMRKKYSPFNWAAFVLVE